MRCAKDWILHCMAISNSRTDTGYWMSMKKSKGIRPKNCPFFHTRIGQAMHWKRLFLMKRANLWSWQKMRLRRTMAAAERLFPLLRLFFWEIFVHQQPLLSFLSPRVVSCIVSAGRNHTMARHHDAKRIFCDSARNRSRGRGLFQTDFWKGDPLFIRLRVNVRRLPFIKSCSCRVASRSSGDASDFLG